jgi:hypothetical protein
VQPFQGDAYCPNDFSGVGKDPIKACAAASVPDLSRQDVATHCCRVQRWLVDVGWRQRALRVVDGALPRTPDAGDQRFETATRVSI